MAARTITCDLCGEKFISYRSNIKYCSDACRKEANLINNRRNKEERKGEYKPTQMTTTLDETIRQAREAGMSYGQYVAQLWLKEHKW